MPAVRRHFSLDDNRPMLQLPTFLLALVLALGPTPSQAQQPQLNLPRVKLLAGMHQIDAQVAPGNVAGLRLFRIAHAVVADADGVAALGGQVGAFPQGLVVMQDDVDDGATGARQNFKLVDWREVKKALGL
jgi:hypothetical protein